MVVRCARRSLQLAAACIILLVAFGCGSSGTGGGSTSGGDTSGGDTSGGNTGGGTVTSRTVTGYISDITTGQGVSGAAVSIGSGVAQTGGTGLFTVRSVPRQTQSVTITASGYKTYTGALSASQDQLNKQLIPVGVPDGYEPPPDAVSR